MSLHTALYMTEQALWWINQAKSPDEAAMRLGLVNWLEQVSEQGTPDSEDAAIEAMIDMAALCAIAYPDRLQKYAEMFYRAADRVASNRATDDA